MGGHGGLNILPQKRWNVYNYENREKVRRDEEAAAKEEQLKREQSRKRDSEFRLERLRTSRNLAPMTAQAGEQVTKASQSNHINLFEGLKEFDIIHGDRRVDSEKDDVSKKRKMKREEGTPRVVTVEDEKYRLGYGVAGKGIKLPWYLERPGNVVSEGNEDDDAGPSRHASGSGGKKSLQELRDERRKRENRENERERQLMKQNMRRNGVLGTNRESGRR